MRYHVLKLAKCADKPERIIIGLMSGTSLDGLDVACCAVSGSGKDTKVKLIHFETLPYEASFKTEIRRVFAKKDIEFQHLVLLNEIIAERHAALVLQCLDKWNIKAADVDLLASHGQTVFHAPRVFHGLEDYPNATLQIGDGDHLAVKTGIITISDFRQKHLAAGGEGAPLALYGDYFLFSKKGEERFLLNIGGIANFTYLPENQNVEQAFATDTGPGNTLLDHFSQELFGVPFDEDARLASNGRVEERLLEILKSEPFFAKALPKTIGPELFSAEWVKAALQQLPKGNINPYDLMTTLTALTAETIAEAIRITQKKNGGTKTDSRVFISGGGAHNPLILKYLNGKLPDFSLENMEVLGINGDAKEAILFALLANETVAGTVEPGQMLGGIPILGMGKISFPG